MSGPYSEREWLEGLRYEDKFPDEPDDGLLDALELLSDAAMLPAGDSSGDAPEALSGDEKGSGEAPEGGS